MEQMSVEVLIGGSAGINPRKTLREAQEVYYEFMAGTATACRPEGVCSA